MDYKTKYYEGLRAILFGRPKPWQQDPLASALKSGFKDYAVVIPPGLETFLSDDIDNDSISVLHGPKGTGKSSLILMKRLFLKNLENERKILCLPRKDRPIFATTASRSIQFDSPQLQGIYSRKETWTALWCVLVGALSLQALIDEENEAKSLGLSDHGVKDSSTPKTLPPSLLDFFLGKTAPDNTAKRLKESDFELYVQQFVKRGTRRAQFDEIYLSVVRPLLQEINSTKRIFVFIDSLDERLEDAQDRALIGYFQQHYEAPKSEITTVKAGILHPRNNESNEIIDPVQSCRDIWVSAQTSLLDAVETILQDSRNTIRLIATMRTEAFELYQGQRALGQVEQIAKRIRYTPEHLKAIFCMNVDLCEIQDAQPELKGANDAFLKFFGWTTRTHWKTSKTEHVWDGILRHTLQKPRDLMIIGNRLHDMGYMARTNVDGVAEKINTATIRILEDYLKYLGVEWDDSIENILYPKISGNVLSKNVVHRIAKEVSAETGSLLSHPFCKLYQVGLLGYPDVNRGGKVLQKFDLEGALQTGRGFGSLPPASHYLIHPVLVPTILSKQHDNRRTGFITSSKVIVGNGYDWPNNIGSSRVRLSLDTASMKPIIEIDDEELGYRPRYSNTDNMDDPKGTFSNFKHLPTIFFVAILLALAKSNNKSAQVEASRLVEAIEYLVNNGIVGHDRNSRGKTTSTVNHVKTQLGVNHSASGGDDYPYPIRQINDYLKQCLNINSCKLTWSRDTQIIGVEGFSGGDIEVTNFGEWDNTL